MASTNYTTRWTQQRGTRSVRIANCSGYKGTSQVRNILQKERSCERAGKVEGLQDAGKIENACPKGLSPAACNTKEDASSCGKADRTTADPGYHMRYQAELGDVDFITGDYLAEVNIAENAQAHAAGTHPGWEQTAWDGIEQTIDLLNKKRIKVVINGGAHNPKGLAEKVQGLVCMAGSCPYHAEMQHRSQAKATISK